MNAPVIRRLATTLAGAAVGAALLLWAFPVRGEMAAFVISPLEGEMSATPTEGGSPRDFARRMPPAWRDLAKAPPSALSVGASHGSRPSFGPPSRGEIDARAISRGGRAGR